MNTDFRVSVSLPTHPKCLKLMRRCGDRAFYCLIRLWAFVAQNRPDGNLKGLDIEDIEIACDWQGDAGSMHRALLELCFIEMLGDALVVHDWADHNSFAIHARERSQKAKKAAEVRWNTQKTCYEHASSNAKSMQVDAFSNAPSPIPTPTPIPTIVKKDKPPIPPLGGSNGDFESFWKAYPKKTSKGHARKTWDKLLKSKTMPAIGTILEAIAKQAESEAWTKDGGQYIPNPATWLNGERWLDEVLDKTQNGKYVLL